MRYGGFDDNQDADSAIEGNYCSLCGVLYDPGMRVVGSIEGRGSILEVEGNDGVEDITANTAFGGVVSGSR